MIGRYSADYSWNVTVVDGTSWTGLLAPDGSINVKVRTNESGTYHPCGALLVTNTSSAAAVGSYVPTYYILGF